MQYFETRCYGLNYIVKEYAKFPRWLPLPGHMEHGWTPFEYALESDLINDKPLMMVFSKRRKDAWKKKSAKPVVILGAPFIHYKNLRKITRREDARGTVVFPSHSTYDLKSCFSTDKFCQELKKLPEKFKPVTVCLFWLDYIDPRSKIYKDYGFKIMTTGPKLSNSLDFPKRFYQILSSHKYATSNDIGTYVFYALDLGVPFFLTGETPLLKNKNKRDINLKRLSARVENYPIGKKATDLFSTGPITKITKKQKSYMVEETGQKDWVSPAKLRQLLWFNYKNNHYWLKTFLPYLLISCFYFLIFNGPWIKTMISLRKRIK